MQKEATRISKEGDRAPSEDAEHLDFDQPFHIIVP